MLIVERAKDLYSQAQKKGRAFTDFLNPVEASALFSVYKNKIRAFGGYPDAERKIIGFGDVCDEDFPVVALSVTCDTRFNKPPGHRDYLGALLGLGLVRDKIGDIRCGENGAVVYAVRDIAGYITANLERVGKAAVKIAESVVFPDLNNNETTVKINVASLRLDAVVSSAFKIARNKAAALIESEKVLVNWQIAAKPSKTLNQGDILTVRGYGRVKIGTEAGRTKKDRMILEVVKY